MTELSYVEHLIALHIGNLEYRRLVTYKLLFELIDLEATDYSTILLVPPFVVTNTGSTVSFIARL